MKKKTVSIYQAIFLFSLQVNQSGNKNVYIIRRDQKIKKPIAYYPFYFYQSLIAEEKFPAKYFVDISQLIKKLQMIQY